MDSVPPEGPVPDWLSTLADHSLAPFILALVIGTPSAVLYALQMGLIVRHRQGDFKSPFFRLFAVRAFADLLGLCGAYVGQRFCRLGLFLPVYLGLPRLVLCLCFFLVVHPFHMENVATVLLLLNRLSTILFPRKHEKFWRVALPYAIASIFLLPLPFTWHIFSLDEYVRLQADNVTFTLDTHFTPSDPNDPQISACSSTVFTLLCLGINSASLVAYRRFKRMNVKAQSEEDSQRMERKLSIYALLTFFGQLLYAVYIILLYLGAFETVQLGFAPELAQPIFLAVYNQMPWVNDLSTLVVPSWTMLWASGPMRRHVLCALVPKKFVPKSGNWWRSEPPKPGGPKLAWSQNEPNTSQFATK